MKSGRILISLLLAAAIILILVLYGVGNLVFMATLVGALVILAGLLAFFSILAPLNRMSEVAAKISEGDFSEPFPEEGIREARILGRSLNLMSLKLRSEIEKREAEQGKLSAVLTGMVEGIVVVDNDLRISIINPAAKKIFDLNGEGLEDRFLLEVIRNSQMDDLLREAIQSDRPLSREITILSPVQRILQIHSTPLRETDQKSGALAVIHDITETRRLETVRTEFVANVSHELRTPLTAIKGFIETLLDGALEHPKDSHRFVKIIEAHADRLRNLIDDLLTLSKLEAKGGEAKFETIDLAEIVRDTVGMLKRKSKEYRITIKVELPKSLPVRADKNKMGQVFINLIDNAIKFNREGGKVTISGEENSENIKVSVSDTGIGIPKKEIERVFERFFRADKARPRELGGTGLGLSIVKHVMEAHRGSVKVESLEGQGSKFTLRMPKNINNK